MEILEIGKLQYCLSIDSSWKCSLSDYYVNLGKKVFVLMDNYEPLSYSIVNVSRQRVQILYVFTPEDKRNKGYASALLEKLRAKFDCLLTADVNTDWPFFSVMKRCFDKMGFKSKTLAKVYNLNCSPQYVELYRKQNPEKVFEYFKRKGFECMTFAKMSEGIKKQLYNSSVTEFDNPFNIKPYFDCQAYKVDLDYSMGLVKDGTLRAYILCTRSSEDTLFLEHATEASSDIGNGIISYPFLVFIGKILEGNEIKKLCFTVSDVNKRSLGLVYSFNQGVPLKVADTVSFALVNQ